MSRHSYAKCHYFLSHIKKTNGLHDYAVFSKICDNDYMRILAEHKEWTLPHGLLMAVSLPSPSNDLTSRQTLLKQTERLTGQVPTKYQPSSKDDSFNGRWLYDNE